MKYSDIIKELLIEEHIEKLQKKFNKNIRDIETKEGIDNIPKIPKVTFFDKGNVYIRKHNRYAEMFPHTHEFVEFNYMAKGSSRHYINGQEIVMKEGDLLLMDQQVVQSIDSLSKNDLLLNILVKEESISTNLVLDLAKSSTMVNRFFLNASSKYSNHKNYLFFKTRDSPEVQSTLHKIIEEYFSEESYFMRYINLQLSTLILELSRFIEKDNEIIKEMTHEDSVFLDIILYIEKNFSTVTLNSLAQKYNFNGNYISNKLKILTGYSYKELVNESRYQFIKYKLKHTDDTIEVISEKAGYKNISALYKFITKYTDKTPLDIRNK